MNTERHSAEEEKSALDTALQHIMTAEEYSHVEHETPHVFKLTIGGAELHYFGSPHSRNPQDPLFKTIKDAFNEAQPDLVLVEGITIPKDKAVFTEQIKTFTREGAIDRAGEAGFALKLATEKGIDYHCPEPSNEDLYNDLLRQGFSQDEIFTWEVFHTLPHSYFVSLSF
jgi:hypothetical protein